MEVNTPEINDHHDVLTETRPDHSGSQCQSLSFKRYVGASSWGAIPVVFDHVWHFRRLSTRRSYSCPGELTLALLECKSLTAANVRQ